VLHIAGVVLLASASIDEARQRARALAALPSTTWIEGMHDRGPWVQWLAGQSPLPKVSATPDDEAVVALLEGDWDDCERLTPARNRRHYPRPIRVGPERLMHWQVMRQIWLVSVGIGPDVSVLKKSLSTLFSHWGREKSDPWYAGIGVGSRLPLLGLIAGITHEDPLSLLYAQRQLNRHLMEPPARTFTMPADVDEAFAAYEALLTEAIAHGGRFTRSFSAGGQDLLLVPHVVATSADGAPQQAMTFRVNPGSSSPSQTFVLPRVDGETIGDLKKRVSAQAGPHESFFALQSSGRPLRLIETVYSVLGAVGATFDVVWTTCSHGAPTHPITGDSMCFWDGSDTANPEY
jgi:hypothetical protein